MAEDIPEVEFIKVDVDEAEEIADALKIQAFPTFHFYRNGAKIDEMMGADDVTLARKVAQYK
jgi:thioredoxin-like negative regulator of GroEL